MIERNLGNIERVVRLALAALFVAWALSRPYLNPVECFVIAVAFTLMLNGVFARCYLWYIWDINTHDERDGNTPPTTVC